MKANGLMVGDLVRKLERGGHSIYVKIIAIYEHNADYETRDGHTGCMSILGYDPIPLTAEILEKNDFRHRQSEVWGDFYTYTYSIKQNDKVLEYEHHFNLSPNPYDGYGFYWIPEMSAVPTLHIRYVHELQHALKLCGIDKEITI